MISRERENKARLGLLLALIIIVDDYCVCWRSSLIFYTRLRLFLQSVEELQPRIRPYKGQVGPSNSRPFPVFLFVVTVTVLAIIIIVVVVIGLPSRTHVVVISCSGRRGRRGDSGCDFSADRGAQFYSFSPFGVLKMFVVNDLCNVSLSKVCDVISFLCYVLITA